VARLRRVPGQAPKTLTANRTEVENRIRPRLGHTAVADLTAHDLDAAYSEWLAAGLAPSSVHRHAAVISAALSQGVKWEWLDSSPARKASPPAATRTRVASWGAAGLDIRLIGVAEGQTNKGVRVEAGSTCLVLRRKVGRREKNLHPHRRSCPWSRLLRRHRVSDSCWSEDSALRRDR